MMLSLAILSTLSNPARAGGGPMDVLVLYNSESEESASLATYYADKRSIPEAHLCGIDGVNPMSRTIEFTEFDALIRSPFEACLAATPDPTEIDIIVLLRGLPYKVDISDGFSTSLGAMLQVGRTAAQGGGAELAGQPQERSGEVWVASVRNPHFMGDGSAQDYELSNSYEFHYRTAPRITSESVTRRSFTRHQATTHGGWDFTDQLFLVSRLDGFDSTDIMDLIDRGVEADGTFPQAPIGCMVAADSPRGARDPECHYTVSMLAAAGISATWIEPFADDLTGETLAGLLTGTTTLHYAANNATLVPGAFMGNLTSFGAAPQNFFCSEDGLTCPASESQTSIARFIRGGATGAHGTVAEPLNNSFPGAGMMLLQTMGFNMLESALFTQRYLYWQNLYLGDPLTTPWAERPVLTIDVESSHPVNWPVHISAEHPDGIGLLRLYLDDLLVAEADGDTLSYTVDPAFENQSVRLLAIATAANAPITREGWPEPEHAPRPDVQGWGEQQVELAAAEPLGDTGSPESEDKACGCTTGTRGAFWMWLLLPLLARRFQHPRAQSQTATSTELPSSSKA